MDGSERETTAGGTAFVGMLNIVWWYGMCGKKHVF